MKGKVVSARWFEKSARSVLRLGCFLLAVFFASASALGAAPASNADALLPHKVQITDPGLARKLESQGAKLIADYGSSRLYEVETLTPELTGNPHAEVRDYYNVINLNTGHLDTRRPEIKSPRQPPGNFVGQRLRLIQFVGPPQAAWRDALLATGAQIVSYLPQNAYLVYGDAAALAKIQVFAATSPQVQWDGPYRDEYKIHPLARDRDARGNPRVIGSDLFEVQLVADDAANAKTLSVLDRIKLEPLKRRERFRQYLNLTARLDAGQLKLIAAQPEVISIQPFFPVKPLCERQDQIVAGHVTNGIPTGPGYLAWLASLGFDQAQFTASGLVVDVSDYGIDNGTTSPDHFGLYTGGSFTNASRVVYSRFIGTTNSGSTLKGCDGHGTINAHLIGGYDNYSNFPFADSNGFHYGLGVCPFVRMGASVIFTPDFTYPSFPEVQSQAWQNGARISCNSWGTAGSEGAYNFECQTFDALVRDAQPADSTNPAPGNQPMVIVFAAGNDGTLGGQTVDYPGTAKNVICVGAAESVQAFGGADYSGVDDSAADNANEVAFFSSRGPCADGRAKPDLLAPGTHVSGGLIQATNNFIAYPDGLVDSCFTGSEISGAYDSYYWPSGQQFYTASSGTSQAAPCVAGGCALVMQYFMNTGSNPPSPAMTKAYLMNSARYLDGASANDTLPSPNQGMGEMNLGAAFDGTPRILRDQVAADLFTNSGEIRAVTGVVAGTNKPFCVTLAWTDAPGSTGGDAYNNNLDLLVTVGTNLYKGNVFNGAYSATGGTNDAINNVESVFLPAGTSGNFAVNVVAASINSVGVPNSNNAVNQDFALVVYNGNSVPMPVVTGAGATLVSEECNPGNGALNPGETVTMDFALQNIGALSYTNLVATLATNSGVRYASGPQSYGALAAAGAPVTMPFTFAAEGICGGSITAVLHLQDGAANIGTISYTLPLGQLLYANTFMENFDGVAAPALPAGWSTDTVAVSNSVSSWATSTNDFDTSPNAAFVGDSTNAGSSTLYSPVIPIATATAQLSFLNFYDLASDPPESSDPDLGYDGGALEIQIGTNAWQDIIGAGGSFVSGAYNTTLPAPGGNPLAGRPVWSGNSGGFVSTVVNLPACAAGRYIRLRWICGTGGGNYPVGSGWYLDTVSISDGYYSCCNPQTAPTLLNPELIGTNLVFALQTVSNQSYSLQSETNLLFPSWTTFKTLTGDGSLIYLTNSALPPTRFYRVISP